MPATERTVTITVAGLIPIISTSMALFGFRRTVDWVKAGALRGAPPESGDVAAVEEGVAALKRVRRYTPWTGRCLARSLALWWVLRRRGVVASLHLGVRRKDGALDAHAWVVHEGRVLADSDSVWTEFPGQFPSNGELAFRRDQ